MKLWAGLLITSLVALAPAAARAEDARLAQVRALVDELEYEAGLGVLAEILADAAVGRDDRTAALALRAGILVGYGCNAAAIGAYQELLRAAPGWTPPASESPKLAECRERARATVPVAAKAAPAPAPNAPPPPPAPSPTTASAAASAPPAAPLSPPPELAADEPLLTRWWFWTAVGAVLGAGAVSTVLVVDAVQPKPIGGNLGVRTWPQ